MIRKIKVSVNIPAYNEERFIRESIESVLSQDYKAFEIIVMDDGSEDNTAKIMKRYEWHPKVRCYFRKKNKGMGATRNELLNLSRGKYISLHDADDIMLPNKLKKQAKFLDSHPEVGVVYGKAKLLNAEGHILKGTAWGCDCKKTWDLLEYVIPPPSAMIRKEEMQKIGGYNEGTISEVDTDLFLKLAETTKIHFINDFFYLYRIHRGNTWRFNKNRFKEFKMVRDEAIKRRYKNRKSFSTKINGENLILNNRFISNIVDTEVIVFDTETGEHYNLNKTASIIWPLLEKEEDIGEIINLITKRLAINAKKAHDDVYSFISTLKKFKILAYKKNEKDT